MTRPRRLPLMSGLVVGAALIAGLTGCAGTVSMQPAEGANSPDCAAVTVRLPAVVDGQPRQWTDAQATGAWGSPSSVLLTCGLETPGPSTLQCETVGGVDWLIDNSEAPLYRFTSFGRTPAVEVFLDYDVVSGRDALAAVSPAVALLPETGSVCTPRVTG